MKNSPQYSYSKYRSKHLTVEQLDLLIKLALVVPTSKIDAIIKASQLIVFSAAVWARRQLIEEEMLMVKEEYERKRTASNQREADDLSFAALNRSQPPNCD